MGFDESGGSARSNGPSPIHPCATWVSLEPSTVLYYASYFFYTPSVCIKLDKPEDDVAKVVPYYRFGIQSSPPKRLYIARRSMYWIIDIGSQIF